MAEHYIATHPLTTPMMRRRQSDQPTVEEVRAVITPPTLRDLRNYLLLTILAAYLILLALSALYGVEQGVRNWTAWKQDRELQTIKFKLVEPIVNAAIDCGRLAFDVVFSALACALTAGTAPISVPLLMMY